MREILKPGLMLFAITAVAAVLLGFVYNITKEPIELAAIAEKEKAMAEILPSATAFNNEMNSEGVDYDNASVIEVLTAYNGSDLTGYIVTSNSKGYGGTLTVLTALDTQGSVIGVSISGSETPGLGTNAYESKFKDQYIGKNSMLSVTTSSSVGENEIAAVTSATVTSRAATNGVNAAISYYNDYIKGGN